MNCKNVTPRKKVGIYFYIALFVVFSFIGMLLAIQFRVDQEGIRATSSDRNQELTAELKEIQKDIDKLNTEISDLDDKIQQAKQGQNEAVNALEDELTRTKLYSGYTKVEGSGVKVIVNDSQDALGNILSFSQDQLLRIVNELRIAGAEAISINGQRLISTSEIRVAGDFINVNLTRIFPPYEILALGSEEMKDALEIPNGYVAYLRDDLGVQVEINWSDSLILPSYEGIPHNEFAEIKR